MAQRQSVSLLLFTTLPDGRIVSVLQKRGVWNFERNGPESFPGACQPLIHGGMNDGETPISALRREAGEETRFRLLRISIALRCGRDEKPITVMDDGFMENYIFMTCLDYTDLANIYLHPGTGGLTFVSEEEVNNVQRLDDRDKIPGVIDRDKIAMYPNHIQALKIAFARLRERGKVPA